MDIVLQLIHVKTHAQLNKTPDLIMMGVIVQLVMTVLLEPAMLKEFVLQIVPFQQLLLQILVCVHKQVNVLLDSAILLLILANHLAY